MTLRNFDTDLDVVGTTRLVVRQTVTVTEAEAPAPPTQATTFLSSGEWDWRALRDYVVLQIETRQGPFPRSAEKESGIFKSFVNRWGAEKAQAIARHAFEVLDGRWAGAPISINRFCKGSDAYFAQPIAERV